MVPFDGMECDSVEVVVENELHGHFVLHASESVGNGSNGALKLSIVDFVFHMRARSHQASSVLLGD